MELLGHKITADRWPWQTRKYAAMISGPDERVGQRYGWKPTRGTGRFGGGWNWSLGFRAGSTTVILELLFGIIRITRLKDRA